MASNYTPPPYYGYPQYSQYARQNSDHYRLRSRNYGDISDMIFQPQHPAQYHLPQQYQQAVYQQSPYQTSQYYATHPIAPAAMHGMQGMQGMQVVPAVPAAMPPVTSVPPISHIPMHYSRSSANIPKSSSFPRGIPGSHINATTKVKIDSVSSVPSSSSVPPAAGPARYRGRHYRSASTPVQVDASSTLRLQPGRSYTPSTSSSRESSIDSDSLQVHTISSGDSMHSADSSVQEEDFQPFKTRKLPEMEPPLKNVTQNAEQIKRVNYRQRNPETKEPHVLSVQQHAVKLQNAKRLLPDQALSYASEGSGNVGTEATSKLILPSDLRQERDSVETTTATQMTIEQGVENSQEETQRETAKEAEKDTEVGTTTKTEKETENVKEEFETTLQNETDNVKKVQQEARNAQTAESVSVSQSQMAAAMGFTPEPSIIAPKPVRATGPAIASAPAVAASPQLPPSPVASTLNYPRAPPPAARSNISSESKSPEIQSPEPANYVSVKADSKKPRTFGAKFRNVFRKSKPEIDSDQKSITSTKSTQSMFSIRSSTASIRSSTASIRSSAASIQSFFGKKPRAESAPNVMSPQLPPQQTPRSPPVPKFEHHRRSQSLMTTPSSSPRVQNTIRTVKNDQPSFIPRPPSPALRSVPGFKAPHLTPDAPTESMANLNVSSSNEGASELGGAGSRSSQSHGNSLNVPTNLSAGDLSPRALTEGDVETLVCPLSRTNSITSNREPSSHRRPSEEHIYEPTKVEASSPPKHEDAKKLVSAMKSSRNRARKRSGATTTGSVSFASQILIYRTFSPEEYNRTPDWMTSDIIREPGVAQMLREELNEWKATMRVHPDSAHNTQFFQTRPF